MLKPIFSGTRQSRLARHLTVIAALLCFLAFSTLSPQAQVLYGVLTGTVTDPTGAAVPGAKVAALNVNTGVTSEAATNESGIYRLQTLQAGTYKVTISAPNFATQVTNSVSVVFNQIVRVDASLKVAQQQQAVTVTSEAPLLQTDKADVHTDVTARQIEDLPTAGTQGRNFQSLLRIIPGAGLTAETNSLAGNPQRAINANINGQSNQTNNTRLDGAQDWYPWLPANVAYVPPADAIEEVNVVTNSFDAEQGMAGGAAINVQIKSGTNNFHGGGHEFYTSQLFQARPYFSADPELFGPKNKNIQHQYGGQLGGPIVRNKLFFFADYERTTQRQLAGPDQRTLPTANMATGDFQGLTVTSAGTQVPVIIYDPLTGNADGTGKQQISCGGVLNVICPERIDPAAQKMIALLQPAIAQETTTGDNLNNFLGSGTALFNRNTADFKVNYNHSQNTTVFGRYSFSKTLVFDPPLLGEAVGDATNGGQLGQAPGLLQSVGLGATHAFTPSILLDWNFGFTRQRLGSTFDLTSAKGLDDLGIPGTNDAGTVGDPSLYFGLPGFVFPSGAPPGNTTNNTAPVGPALGNAQPANPFLFRDQQYVTGANLSWIRGKHAFRGGIEWNHGQINHFQPQGGTFQQPRGSFIFNGYATSLQGGTLGPQWFNAWADFLLGLPTTTGKAVQLFNPNAIRFSQWAWYLQDHWQVTPKLTVSLGVRWEYYPFGYADNGLGLRYLDPLTGNVLIGGKGNVPRDDGIDVGSGQWLPRVGVAYRLTSSTVVRAGFGQSADPTNWRFFRNSFPSVVIVNNVSTNTGQFIPAASLTGLNGTGLGGGSYNVPTGILLPALPDLSSGVVPLPANVGTTTAANPFRRGYINSFNFTVQQDWKGTVFETGYVGARGIRPIANVNLNASLPGTGNAGGLLTQRYRNLGILATPALDPEHSCTPVGTTPTCVTGGVTQETPFGNNYYDSMQTKVTRRFAGGSMAGFAWTWSKAITYGDNCPDTCTFAYSYPTLVGRGRANADFDRTHNFEIYGVLQSPFGKGQHWAQTGVAGWILGGWQFNPVISRLSGTPFTVTANNLNANGATQTADLVGKFHIINGRPPQAHVGLSQGDQCPPSDLSCHYFDPTAFAQPLITGLTDAHFGNTFRNQFRGPGYFQMNLSIHRAFDLSERISLDLRADIINFTNTPHFANPNAGCGSAIGTTCDTGVFGVVTARAQPGGFFGPDEGNRLTWFGAKVTF
jgi:hypothetical protein